MEFLVRVEDKINTQVFCLNPVHKGNHMDRVFFEDKTFEALCPDCGSGDWLYRKNNAISKKGHFITFKEDGWSWGTNELKHYGIARIDCTYEQAKEWCESVQDEQVEENLTMIAYRPRKMAFDFENVLTVEQLKNWNDMDKYSEIVGISEEDKTQIKEIQWH